MAKLHFIRVRKAGEPSFFDAQTDIRSLVPKVVELAISSMYDACDAGNGDSDDVSYMSVCLHIFRTRILEDRTPFDEQLSEFFDALQKVDRKTFMRFLQRFTYCMLSVYGLFCRRDSATDRNILKEMISCARLAQLKGLLSEETYERVRKELSVSMSSFLLDTDSDADAVCQETGDVIEDIKAIARTCMSFTSERGTWNDLAELCDKEFYCGTHSDKESIALALAYPTYENQSLVVEANEPEGKAKQPGQAG